MSPPCDRVILNRLAAALADPRRQADHLRIRFAADECVPGRIRGRTCTVRLTVAVWSGADPKWPIEAVYAVE